MGKGKIRKLVAIGTCGLVMGGVMSVFAAPQATGRMLARCDTRVETMEAEAAKLYKKGKISKAQYDATMQQLAQHRRDWGC